MSVGADVDQTVPLIHAELADADLDIKAIVIFRVDAALRQVLPAHVDVGLLASFDLRDEPASRLGEVAHRARHEAFPPQMLLHVGPRRSLSRSDADEGANVSAGPFVDRRLIEYLR